MQISQIQAAADAIQDRLVLRIAGGNNEEIRVFVTRRFLKELWPGLVAMLHSHLGAATPAAGLPPPADFSQPYRNEDPVFPLGATPLLPAEARIEPAGHGQCTLTLREPRERSLTFKLTAPLLQALCAMLRSAAETAQWDLALDNLPAAARAGSPSHRQLH